MFRAICSLTLGTVTQIRHASLLRFLGFRRRCGMVHMHDAPFSFALPAKGCSSGQDRLSVEVNLEIIFHPNCVANQMVRARNQRNLCGRMLAEIPFAILLYPTIAAVKIT